MGEIHAYDEEKLIVGVIYHDKDFLEKALTMLTDMFGETDCVSDEFSFSAGFSDYYDEEIGGEGLRRFYSFRRLVNPSEQAKIKTATNRMEKELSVDGKRRINLDPGFMNIGRLMLATTKNAWFRVPLSDGIYTELTLFWARKRWNKMAWTYMDYQSETVQKFLTKVHKIYLEQRKAPET